MRELLARIIKMLQDWGKEQQQFMEKRDNLIFLSVTNFLGAAYVLAMFVVLPSWENIVLAGSCTVAGLYFAFVSDEAQE